MKTLGVESIDEVLSIERSAYPLPWSKGMLESSLQKDCVWGLFESDQLIAYSIISFVLDEAHLLNICVDPRFSGKGFGRQMLRKVIDEAIAHKSVMIFLEVRVSNEAAISLYHSEGFNEIGIRPNYYPAVGGGKEDAVLMCLELKVSTRV